MEKPLCPICKKRTVNFYIRVNRLFQSQGFYCANCRKTVETEKPEPVVYRMDIHDFLNSHREKYNVIYVDPPWQYRENTTTSDLRIENHYTTMASEELARLPIQDISEKNAILFLWCPNPKISEGLKIIESWQFDYSTKITWIKISRNGKPRMSLGHNVRSVNEDLLIAKRGNFPVPSKKFQSVFNAQQKNHSEKPDIVYSMIEEMYPEGHRIELFGRKIRKGWTGIGLEAEPLK